MISSPDIDKYLRKYLSPILRENGFTRVSARKAWGWENNCILVLQIRAVGNYFSGVTGWPPMSVSVFTGVYYDFIPFDERTLKVDEKARLIPDQVHCHMRSHLSRTLDQGRFTNQLALPAERERRDLWWFERDGSNIKETVENIAWGFVDEGKPWFERYKNLEMTFAEIEAGADCYTKFYQAECFARRLGLTDKRRLYGQKRIEEWTRFLADPVLRIPTSRRKG